VAYEALAVSELTDKSLLRQFSPFPTFHQFNGKIDARRRAGI
jgi:hypothetical protein